MTRPAFTIYGKTVSQLSDADIARVLGQASLFAPYVIAAVEAEAEARERWNTPECDKCGATRGHGNRPCPERE